MKPWNMKKSTASSKVEWLQMQGSQTEETAMLAAVTDTKLRESDPFADVEDGKDELEENKLVLKVC